MDMMKCWRYFGTEFVKRFQLMVSAINGRNLKKQKGQRFLKVILLIVRNIMRTTSTGKQKCACMVL